MRAVEREALEYQKKNTGVLENEVINKIYNGEASEEISELT
jgi:hypothetical protein